MTGALCGAFGGLAAVPVGLVEALENQEIGRDYIRDLADRLYGSYEARIGVSS